MATSLVHRLTKLFIKCTFLTNRCSLSAISQYYITVLFKARGLEIDSKAIVVQIVDLGVIQQLPTTWDLHILDMDGSCRHSLSATTLSMTKTMHMSVFALIDATGGAFCTEVCGHITPWFVPTKEEKDQPIRLKMEAMNLLRNSVYIGSGFIQGTSATWRRVWSRQCHMKLSLECADKTMFSHTPTK